MNNLLKTSALTLAALVGVASVTAPALADGNLKFDGELSDHPAAL